jgi:lysophospholipase L1-like esterase
MKLIPFLFAVAAALTLPVAAHAQDKPGLKSCTPARKDPGRHEAFLKDKAAALARGPVQLVFIGDSITDGWRGGKQNAIYKERWAKYNPYNIGISGDETQHVLWRIENGELDGLTPNPKVAVMMIGTNNIGNANQMSAADTAKGIECLVKAIQEKLPDTRLLLLGVFPRGDKAPEVNAKVAEINAQIAKLDDGGKHVKFMDIGGKFLDADGKLPREVMPDLLHPNDKGYAIWADAIGPVIDEMAK